MDNNSVVVQGYDVCVCVLYNKTRAARVYNNRRHVVVVVGVEWSEREEEI